MPRRIVRQISEDGVHWETEVVEDDGGDSSQPQLVVQEFTAAEVAAAWFNDYLQAAVALVGVASDDLIQRIWEDENSLDQGLSFDELCAYLPDESTANVSDNAVRLNGVIGARGSESAYAYTVTRGTTDAAIKDGAQAYALFVGDAAPTTGTLTIKMVIVAA